MGRRRREWIVGDLRCRRTDARDERRLASIGEPDDTDVSEKLQLESQPPAFARASQIRLTRRAVGGRRAAGVPPAPSGARLDEDPLPGTREIAQRLFTVAIRHDGTDRHVERQVIATGAMPVGALPVLAALRFVVALVVVVQQ